MQAENGTVYTVRIQTASGRRSCLSDLHAGVQLCLIGQDNQALLHRVCQLEENVSAHETMADICEVRPQLSLADSSRCCVRGVEDRDCVFGVKHARYSCCTLLRAL